MTVSKVKWTQTQQRQTRLHRVKGLCVHSERQTRNKWVKKALLWGILCTLDGCHE